ncbi:MAG: hypothetical protein WCQ41_09215 [Bacillota bacterium]
MKKKKAMVISPKNAVKAGNLIDFGVDFELDFELDFGIDTNNTVGIKIAFSRLAVPRKRSKKTMHNATEKAPLARASVFKIITPRFLQC